MTTLSINKKEFEQSRTKSCKTEDEKQNIID